MRIGPPLVLTLLTITVLAGCTDDRAPAEVPDAAPAPVVVPSPVIPEAESFVNVHGIETVRPRMDFGIANLRDAILEGRSIVVPGEPVYLLAGVDPRDTGMQDFEMRLRPSNLLTNATWAEVNGTRVPMPFVETYEGSTPGADEDNVRLTISSHWARGTVRIDDVTYRVRLNMTGNFPVGTELREDYGTPGARVAPEIGYDPPGWGGHDCLSLVPQPLTPVTPVTPPSGEIRADIILDADALFVETLGHHSMPMMVAFLNEVDHIYDHQVDLRFHIMGLHVHLDPDFYPDPADHAPLAEGAAYWKERDLDRDMVHIYTGYPSSYAQANCIGGAGMPQLAYTFTTIHWASEASGKHRHIQTYAHELGHILNAHHHYGNPVEGGVSTTIMHQGGEKVHPVFSTFSRSVIRGWAEAHIV